MNSDDAGLQLRLMTSSLTHQHGSLTFWDPGNVCGSEIFCQQGWNWNFLKAQEDPQETTTKPVASKTETNVTSPSRWHWFLFWSRTSTRETLWSSLLAEHAPLPPTKMWAYIIKGVYLRGRRRLSHNLSFCDFPFLFMCTPFLLQTPWLLWKSLWPFFFFFFFFKYNK